MTTPQSDHHRARALRAAHRLLERAYGPQHWWPARSRWEVIVGAVLVQHTQWKNVERAVAALRAAGALSVAAVDAIAEETLAELVRPAGTPTVKARRLKGVARFVQDEAGGSLRRLFAGARDHAVALALRRRLLTIHGVGPETADAILLYAGGAPVAVVDAYQRRVMARHGWVEPDIKYDPLQRAVEEALPRDAALLNEHHALVVRVGVEHCHARAPRCAGCPLESLLPGAEGDVEVRSGC